MDEPTAPALSAEEKNWGMACHLAALAGYFIPMGNIIGPLIVWLMKKDVFPFVAEQGKESLNFQISLMIYCLVAAILILVVIGVPLLIGIGIFGLVEIIIAGVAASNGKSHVYPLTIRFIK